MPGRAPAGQDPGAARNLQGYVESPIYARATGYLLRWHKDIGASVRKGELLAELDTPEIDQQLRAGDRHPPADPGDACELARRSSMTRWQALRKKDAVSQQELDERSSAYAQAVANLTSHDANVRRLQNWRHSSASSLPSPE
ncbi:MAG: hypothetical protein QM702_20665 [Rubrivivax sp.]